MVEASWPANGGCSTSSTVYGVGVLCVLSPMVDDAMEVVEVRTADQYGVMQPTLAANARMCTLVLIMLHVYCLPNHLLA